ncbi:MAG: NAAT family transporter [bacterium]|nr:NAAT family transporter [bacterium]
MVNFFSLFPIINPIGMSSVFLGLTSHFSRKDRHKTAYKVALYSALLLIGVLFFGKWILGFFGLSLPFIRIAGGLLVSFTAWQMLNATPKLSDAEKNESKQNDDITFFPLTLPITAGAGAIAITIATALKIPDYFSPHSITLYLGAVTGLLLMMLAVALCYRFSDTIFQKLGKTGTVVITRLSAFILLAIGLQIIWQGLLGLITIAKHIK